MNTSGRRNLPLLLFAGMTSDSRDLYMPDAGKACAFFKRVL